MGAGGRPADAGRVEAIFARVVGGAPLYDDEWTDEADEPDEDDEDDEVDHDTLRRWFMTDLWGAAEPSWFLNVGPDAAASEAPAAVGIDDDVVAVIWCW